MQFTVDERNAIESGQPVRLPVAVVDEGTLKDIYFGLTEDSPEDWKPPADWARELTPG